MKAVSRNLLSIALGDVGSRLLGFLATAYLARTLLPDGFGLLNLGFAIYGYLFLISSPGIQVYGARAAAQSEGTEAALAGDIVGLRILLALACTVTAAAISALLIADPSLQLIVVLYVLSLFPVGLLLDWFFQGKELMQGIGWSRIVTNIVYVGILFAIVHDPSDVTNAPIAFFLGNTAGAILLLSIFRARYGSFRIRWRLPSLLSTDGRWFQIMKGSLPIGFGAMMGQVSYNFAPIFLGIVSTTAAVGYYAAALRVVFFLMLFDRLVSTLLLPVIARYQRFAPEQLGPMLSFVLKWMLIVVLPVTVGGVLVAEPLIVAIYGVSFIDATPVFQILVWFFLFSASSSVYVFGLIGIGEERLYAKMMGIGTSIQLACISIGTIFAGAVGAAAGYAFGEAITLILTASRFRAFVHVPYGIHFLRPAIAAVAMGALVFPLREGSLFLSVPWGALSFFVVLFLIRGVTKDDFTTIKAKLL